MDPGGLDRANKARKKIGIRFDATAGLKNGVANTAHAMRSWKSCARPWFPWKRSDARR